MTLDAPADAGDIHHLRGSYQLARRARQNGNHPFGAVLVSQEGEILLEAENTVLTSKDVTAHAERNLLSRASQLFDADVLRRATLYASTEPCSMCATAARWAGIGRVVYGLSQSGLYNLDNPGPAEPSKDIGCRELLAFSSHPVKVAGPLLEEEGAAVHEGFWR